MSSSSSSRDSSSDGEDDDQEVQQPHNMIHSNELGLNVEGNSKALFEEFNNKLGQLEEQLFSFQYAVQKLGSAIKLSVASHDVRAQLKEIRTLFIALTSDGNSTDSPQCEKSKGTEPRPDDTHIEVQSTSKYEKLWKHFSKLCLALEEFSNAIQSFDEYSDQDGYKSLRKFQEDILHLLCKIKLIERKIPSMLDQYITGSMSNVNVHLNNLDSAIKRFRRQGIPCINRAQERSTNLLMNTATVATFFAGIAASAAQSVPLEPSNREIAIGTLWFSSLVLSMGSALTAMLALAWRQAVFSSSKRTWPWFIYLWVRQGYLILLAASIMTFLAGLIIYTFDSRHRIIFWAVIFFTAFCGTGLTSVALWYGYERLQFSYLKQVLAGQVSSIEHGLSKYFVSPWRYCYMYLSKTYLKGDDTLRPVTVGVQTTSSWLPTYRWAHWGHCASIFGNWFLSQPAETPLAQLYLVDGTEEKFTPQKQQRMSPSTESHTISPWNLAEDMSDESSRYKIILNDLSPIFSVERLRRVKHLQFSFDGKWLVICTIYNCSVYQFGDPEPQHLQNLSHPSHARQAEWSPNGEHLLTRDRNAAVMLWSSQDRFSQAKTFKYKGKQKNHNLSDMQWLNNDEFLVLAEDSSEIYRVSFGYQFDYQISVLTLPSDLSIQSMYSLYELDIMLLVAEWKIEGLPKGKGARCLMVYDTNMKEGHGQTWGKDAIESVPLSHNIEYLAFERNSSHLLVIYSDMDPEIWTVDKSTRSISSESKVILKVPNKSNNSKWNWHGGCFIGPCSKKIIVACQTNTSVHFWEKGGEDEFKYLHSIKIRGDVGEPPIIRWNPGSKLPIMVSGGRFLPLQFWSSASENKANWTPSAETR